MTTPADKAATDSAEVPARITLEDVQHRAQRVRDLAVSETKEAAARVMELDAMHKALVVAGVALAVVSFAYLLGTRAGRRGFDVD